MPSLRIRLVTASYFRFFTNIIEDGIVVDIFITEVADGISICIFLEFVCDLRAIIARISFLISIEVSLIAVGYKRTVIEFVLDTIIVSIIVYIRPTATGTTCAC